MVRPLRPDVCFVHGLAAEEHAEGVPGGHEARRVGQAHELGREAKDAAGAEARGKLYGEFLGTCADCHKAAKGK